jgi:glycosyltransferase involved in cell wall biosynthesis
MRSKNSLLTIAIPVYERIDFFEDALSSALSQEYECEVIVVDNCSSHNRFREICDMKNGRVKYFRNDSNLGLFGNWNKCFEFATSEFVMILGDDDILHKSYSKIFVNELRKKKFDIFYSNFYFLDDNNQKLIENNFSFSCDSINAIDMCKFASLFGLGFPTITLSIRRDKFKGYFDHFTASNDWYWIYLETSGLTFKGVNQKLVLYRKHSKSDTNEVSVFKYRISHAAIYLKISQLLNNNRLHSVIAYYRAIFEIESLQRKSDDFENAKKYYLNTTDNNPYLDIFNINYPQFIGNKLFKKIVKTTIQFFNMLYLIKYKFLLLNKPNTNGFIISNRKS